MRRFALVLALTALAAAPLPGGPISVPRATHPYAPKPAPPLVSLAAAAAAPAPDPAECRIACADARYACEAANGDCSGAWSRCVATCDLPNLDPRVSTAP